VFQLVNINLCTIFYALPLKVNN